MTTLEILERPVMMRLSGFGMYAMWAVPLNGAMWCSHVDVKWMLSTIIMSSDPTG